MEVSRYFECQLNGWIAAMENFCVRNVSMVNAEEILYSDAHEVISWNIKTGEKRQIVSFFRSTNDGELKHIWKAEGGEVYLCYWSQELGWNICGYIDREGAGDKVLRAVNFTFSQREATLAYAFDNYNRDCSIRMDVEAEMLEQLERHIDAERTENIFLVRGVEIGGCHKQASQLRY